MFASKIAIAIFLLSQTIGYVAAQTTAELPPNTIDCNGFTKLPNGAWYAKADNPSFDLGNVKHMTITSSTFGTRGLNLGGYDLATVLDAKCGVPSSK
jgi:hypothetical protein